jgi:hypothetical protein
MTKRSKNEWRVYKKILLPYKENKRIFNDPKKRPKPITLRINGATIVIPSVTCIRSIYVSQGKIARNFFSTKTMDNYSQHLLEIKSATLHLVHQLQLSTGTTGKNCA